MKHIGLLLQDLTTGTSINSTMKFLNQSQFWSINKIESFQVEKLRALVQYAGIHVPYYRDLFKKINFNYQDIISVKDIRKIPILTKEIMREQGDRLLSEELNKFKLKIGKTGGTTGAPISIYKDQHNRTLTWASYYRWYTWMGLTPYSKSITLWGAKTVLNTSWKNRIYDNIKAFLSNNLVINSFTLGEDSFPIIAENILSFKPELLKGYLSALLIFAEYVERNNIVFPSLKALSSTTETLLPHNRKYLETVFGVPIYDQYGCGEVSAIAYECSGHNGLHINQ